ncbi:MAG: hypothetical protein ABIH41_01360 [Nanoarchaeota archaeon]
MRAETIADEIDVNIFKRVIKTCLAPTDESILLLSDEGTPSSRVAPAIHIAYRRALNELGIPFKQHVQTARFRGEAADPGLIEQLRRLPPRSAIIISMSNRLGSIGRVGLSFRKYARQNQHKFISASSFGGIRSEQAANIIDTFDIDYHDLQRNAARIKASMDAAREIHVTSKEGSDFIVNVDGKTAVANAGDYTRFGTGGNLPCGETYIPPEGRQGVEGTIVVDGSIRLRDQTILAQNPLELRIEKGKIARISDSPEGRMLANTLDWADAHAKNPDGNRRIGEFSMALNKKARVVGATIIDEKTFGTCHIANGSNAWFGGNIYAKIHLDHIIRHPKIHADGKRLLFD